VSAALRSALRLAAVDRVTPPRLPDRGRAFAFSLAAARRSLFRRARSSRRPRPLSPYNRDAASPVERAAERGLEASRETDRSPRLRLSRDVGRRPPAAVRGALPS
jgi:hypothetical protein